MRLRLARCSTMVLNSKMQSYGDLPALLFRLRISASAMVGRKLSQSMIFSRSRQSPSSLNFSNLYSSANKEICFIFRTHFPCYAYIISYFAVCCNRLGIFRGSLIRIKRCDETRFIMGASKYSACGESRASSVARRIFVTISEQNSGGKDSSIRRAENF